MAAARAETASRAGKNCARGKRAVTIVVVENAGVPSEACERVTTHADSTVMMPKSNGMDATVRKRPRTSVNTATTIAATPKHSR